MSQYAAGFLSANDLGNPTKVKIYKGTPVCGLFRSYRGLFGPVVVLNTVVAAAQIHQAAVVRRRTFTSIAKS